MKKTTCLSLALLAAISIIMSCQKDLPTPNFTKAPVLPESDFDYALKFPATFNNGFSGNVIINDFPILIDVIGGFGSNIENPQITNSGATLGRVLFYDPQLSLNNTISCASCHKQNQAFSDGLASSTGFGGKTTPRNSMAIVNPVLNNNLFWDSRSSSVMDLVTRPIQNHIEMGIEDMPALARKLEHIEYYQDLFQKSFGSPQITEDRIANALAQFVCSITTTDSKFDQGISSNFSNYNSLEKQGMELFQSERLKCSQCHAGSNFAAADFPGGPYGGPTIKGTANIGLESVAKDKGKENGQFRIPSLRNIALTAPYMHDGRFTSLEDVVEHYNSGIRLTASLDTKLRNADGSAKRMGLNELEKRALVAFLKTLTDETLLRDPKYSDPFQ